MIFKKTPVDLAKVSDLLKIEILKKIKQKSFSIHLKGNSRIYRFEFPIGQIDPLSWLQAQSIQPKIYWCDRKQDFELAGIGKADLIRSGPTKEISTLFQTVRQSLADTGQSLRYLGGISFNISERNDLCWKSFGNFYFILPQIEIVRQQGHTFFVANFRFKNKFDWNRQENRISNLLEQVDFAIAEQNEKIPHLLKCQYNPDQEQWRHMIAGALREIELGNFEKIVLARQSRLEFNGVLNALTLIRRLKLLDPDNVYFYLQPEADICFITATPEILYTRQGRKISSEAVAATRLRGKDSAADKQLEQELLNSTKDIQEHRFVVKSIHDTLQPMCRTLSQPGKTRVLKQARIQHLYAPFHGELKPNVHDDTLITNLHPTPAVGGFPSKPALDCLQTLEPFKRGWYAAPVGWVSTRAAKFAVAIRSGLICKNQLVLYSGAGIVKGSKTESEWNETSNKISGYLNILGIQDNLYFNNF